MNLRLLGFCLVILCSDALAEGKGELSHERPRKPPQEAIDACHNFAEYDAVVFTGRYGAELNATCLYIDGTLVAVPKRHKKHA